MRRVAKQMMLVPMLTLAISAVACGGKKEADNAQKAPEMMEAAPAAERVLNLYSWADYFPPEILEAFTQSTGIKVVIDTYDSNESLQGKLMAGATGYDVILPSDYMVTILAKSDVIQPLDTARLPNVGNLDDQFKNPAYDPGLKYSVPFQWGSSGIGYLSDKIAQAPDSWAALLTPAPELKGRISMLKDTREVFGAALKWKGHSVNTTDEVRLREAKELLAKQSPMVKVYNSDSYKDQLAQGEVYLAHGWSSIFALARYKLNDKIRYVIPKEGAIIWVDTMAIPKSAPHIAEAYAFLDYFLNGKNAAMVCNTVYGSTPNKAAKEFIKPELLNDPSLYPPPEVLQRLEYISDIGKATKMFDDMWTEVRAQ